MLLALAKRGEDARPALREIMDELRLAEDPWFASRGAGLWLPLADITRAQKAEQGYSSDTLVRTGALRTSLTAKSRSKSIRRVSKDRLRFGTNVFYARFHAYGEGVPLRDPLIPLDERTRRRMVSDVQKYVLTGRMPS